jgi:phosphohistidine phosphatase
MAKRLVIVRHGKSTWDYGGVEDIDRPLKEKGINYSYDVARMLKNDAVVPGLIISSPATRALHTAIIFARILDFSCEKIIIKEGLYEASENEVLKMIGQTPDDIEVLMVFGHNPFSSSLANRFLQGGIDNVPTSGAVLLDFPVDKWNEISKSDIVYEKLYFSLKV